MSEDPRWPQWVYVPADEPDYRFTLANERTFLAWIRTALALLAAGVALRAIDLSMPHGVQRWLGFCLVFAAAICAVLSWFRWAVNERAMRRRGPLPGFGWIAILSGTLAVVAVVFLVAGMR